MIIFDRVKLIEIILRSYPNFFFINSVHLKVIKKTYNERIKLSNFFVFIYKLVEPIRRCPVQ